MLRSLTKPLSLVIAGWVGCSLSIDSLPAIAQEYVPPRRGIPGRREGGGTRGPCIRGQKLLMPLIPQDAFGATLSTEPAFFWFVPRSNAAEAEFKLMDVQSRTEVYSDTLSLTGEAGIVSLRLPKSVTTSSIKPGQNYVWQFTLVCSKSEPSANIVVEGNFQQFPVDPLLNQKLQQASLPDRSAIYAANGIWQDAINILVQQRCTNPADSLALNRWKTLLRSVKLDNYANEPIQASCLSNR